MTGASWQDKMTEILKQMSRHVLNADTWITCNTKTNNRSNKRRYILQINIEIKTPFANETNEKKIRQNSKLKCLNKDVFDIFYADCIEFQNYINGMLKILLNQ